MDNIVIASDSHKEFATSTQVAKWIKKGIMDVLNKNNISIIPISDGGEGLIESIVSARNGTLKEVNVKDPLFRETIAKIGLIDDNCKTAIVEISEASGLHKLKPKEKNPLYTTSYGTGQLIECAAEIGCRKIIIGLGGAATSDGGIGAMYALGTRFLDKNKDEILISKHKGYSAEALSSIEYIDYRSMLPKVRDLEFVIAYDVNNPLYGKNGAARTYGPQKGASPKVVEELEKGLVNYSNILSRDFGKDFNVTGTGAAGGFAVSLLAICGAKLYPGIDIALDYLDFKDRIKDADLVITGEGCLDELTLYNKAPLGIARMCREKNKKVVGVFGTIKHPIESLTKYFDDIIDASNGSNVHFNGDYREKAIKGLIESGRKVAKNMLDEKYS